MSAALPADGPELLRVLRQIFQDSHDAVAISRPSGEHLYQNARHRRLFGVTEAGHVRGAAAIAETETLQRVVGEVLARGELHETLIQQRDDGQARHLTLSVYRVDAQAGAGEAQCLIWVSRSVFPTCLPELPGEPEVVGGMQRLADELALANREYQRLLDTDLVTGVRNRHGLTRLLALELGRARRDETDLVAVLIDCDDFKRINDRLGFGVGDIVLREVARRLQEAAQRTDLIARIGGDQFLVVLPSTPLDTATGVAERLRLAVASSPIIIADDVVDVTVSVGVVELPRSTSTLEEVLTISYRALHASKRDGKNRVSSGQFPRIPTTRTTRPQLAAVEEQLLGLPGIRAFSQPIVRLGDEHTVGFEMLARGPLGPFESPMHFFRLSLEANILTAVDLRCLQTCIETGRTSPSPQIHLNIFPSTLLATPLGRLLELFAGETRRFVLELSEQQFLGDVQTLRPTLDALRSQGVRVALDDVGFGRSSLEALLVLEPDIVKIDRSCVHRAWSEPDKARLLSRLVTSVHALGADLVAEGIETREDLALLQSLGVAYGQGYLWGEPCAGVG